MIIGPRQRLPARLLESYRCCREIVRRADSNFGWALRMLPRPQRRAMQALYAFARHSDDLTDSDDDAASRRAALERWREQVERALAGAPRAADHPLLPGLSHAVDCFALPHQSLRDVLDGVAMDLEPRPYPTFDDLREYCRRVASAVGQSCVRIWGCKDPQVHAPAEDCGVAFQLTNILRDLKEDAARGRLYLPLEDLQHFNYSFEDLRRGICDARLRALLRFQIARAESLYRQAESTGHYLRGPGRRVFGVMFDTYQGLLAEIKRRDGRVFGDRIRVPRRRKLEVLLRSLVPSWRPPAPGRSGSAAAP